MFSLFRTIYRCSRDHLQRRRRHVRKDKTQAAGAARTRTRSLRPSKFIAGSREDEMRGRDTDPKLARVIKDNTSVALRRF